MVNMKIISVTILFIFFTLIFASCRQKTKEEVKSIDLNVSARNYLQPMLQIGDYSTNIIARFGLPIRQYETGTHELCMYFLFSDTNHAATGVGGFAGFFTNNQLAHWEPIYKR